MATDNGTTVLIGQRFGLAFHFLSLANSVAEPDLDVIDFFLAIDQLKVGLEVGEYV